jgi:hypothetical protein
MLMKMWLTSILLGCSLYSALAQLPGSTNNPTNQLSVQLWLPHTSGLQAPASIDIQAYIQIQEEGLKAGDFVNVEFFANSKSIGSAKAVWHDTIRPHAKPGRAVPMWIMPAGFYPAQWTWKDVPSGDYSLTAQATRTNGLSAMSPAASVTVTSK